MANPNGQPLKFKTPEILQKAVDKYFQETPFSEYTITGLALALGTYRQTLCNYEARDGYSDIIKTAKQRVEHSYEVDLKQKGTSGSIFALKNFDWKDKQETDNKNTNLNTDLTYSEYKEQLAAEREKAIKEKRGENS